MGCVPRHPHNSRAHASSQERKQKGLQPPSALRAETPTGSGPWDPDPSAGRRAPVSPSCSTRSRPWTPAGRGGWQEEAGASPCGAGDPPPSPRVDVAMGQSAPSPPAQCGPSVPAPGLLQGCCSLETQMRLVDGGVHPRDMGVASPGSGQDQLHPSSPGPEPHPHCAQQKRGKGGRGPSL